MLKHLFLNVKYKFFRFTLLWRIDPMTGIASTAFDLFDTEPFKQFWREHIFSVKTRVIKHNMRHLVENVMDFVDGVAGFVDENIVSVFCGKLETKQIFFKFIRENPDRLVSLRRYMTNKFFGNKVSKVIAEMINNVYHSGMLPVLCQFTPRYKHRNNQTTV